ncbi:ATP-binding protein [Streptomyces sp. NPDC088197]|uniref:ATP-binding protein n=1 Tax=unclassified Streptomyces TaxID=2593676 RepID=UPI0033BB94E6
MTAPTMHELPVTEREFSQRFSATRRGARLARHAASNELHLWGVAHGTELAETAALLVAELATNAATHGRVAGRDFELRIRLTATLLRIDVSDARGERRPPDPGQLRPASPLSDSGRGLLLVEALATRWSVLPRDPVGKTLRAELDLPLPLEAAP